MGGQVLFGVRLFNIIYINGPETDLALYVLQIVVTRPGELSMKSKTYGSGYFTY